jgi:ectoine hydroxylase-related dioxygenase (phytanoyl-CoA dioxygenase family)
MARNSNPQPERIMSETRITPEQWQFYEDNGYLKLGQLLNAADLAALQERIDQIMLGDAKLDYGRVLMQLDSDTGKYEDSKEASRGHKGRSLNYRKIQDLEFDDLFLEYMQRPIFQEICAKVYGGQTPIAAFRAMFMNKPAHKGTFLPWHQDRWTHLDRDPLITLWTALDPATVANGCVQIVPGSQNLGLVNPAHGSGFLTPEQAATHCPKEKVEYLELKPGEAALLHNWLLHASDVKKTDIPRRAFSVCYMDAATRHVRNAEHRFPVIFGEAALRPEAVAAA